MPPKFSPAPLSPLLVATAMGQAGRLEHNGMQRTGPRSRSPRRHPGPAVRACGRLLGFTSPGGPTASPPLPSLLLAGPGPSEMPAAHAEPRTQTKHKTAWGGGAGPAAEPAHERRPSSLAALHASSCSPRSLPGRGSPHTRAEGSSPQKNAQRHPVHQTAGAALGCTPGWRQGPCPPGPCLVSSGQGRTPTKQKLGCRPGFLLAALALSVLEYAIAPQIPASRLDLEPAPPVAAR